MLYLDALGTTWKERNNFNKSTYDGDFNALFAIQSVPMLLCYYKIFKELNPKIRIGAVFTYAANDSQDDEQTGMNQGFANDKVTADEFYSLGFAARKRCG